MTTRCGRSIRCWLAVWVAFVGCGPATPPPPAGTTVGPSGGTVTSADGRARLVVPAGALAAPVALSLQVAAAVPLDPHAVQAAAYRLDPASTAFALPAALQLDYQPAGGPSGTPEPEWAVRRLEAGVWGGQALGTADPGHHRAEAAVTAGGTYGLVWSGPTAPCTEPADREFDFWLGAWRFAAGGAFPGTDDVTLEGQGCLLEERFQDTSGTRGRSVSLRSRLDGRWHQTYVDSQGGRLVLVGQRDGARMVLLQSPTVRYLWEPTAPGVVRYWMERALEGGAAWEVRFDATYTLR